MKLQHISNIVIGIGQTHPPPLHLFQIFMIRRPIKRTKILQNLFQFSKKLSILVGGCRPWVRAVVKKVSKCLKMSTYSTTLSLHCKSELSKNIILSRLGKAWWMERLGGCHTVWVLPVGREAIRKRDLLNTCHSQCPVTFISIFFPKYQSSLLHGTLGKLILCRASTKSARTVTTSSRSTKEVFTLQCNADVNFVAKWKFKGFNLGAARCLRHLHSGLRITATATNLE